MPSITVGLAAVDILGRNANRMTFTMRNESTAGQKIYFWLQAAGGLVITNADYVLGVSEEKSFILAFDGRDIKNPVAAIADAAAGKLYYAETME